MEYVANSKRSNNLQRRVFTFKPIFEV